MCAEDCWELLRELEQMHVLVAQHRNAKVVAGLFDAADERLWESAMQVYWSKELADER